VKQSYYYNPQTNVFDYLKKRRRSWDSYDPIWKSVGKCVFCDLKERYVIFEKGGIVLTSNLFPYTDAHLLIVPRRHIEYAKEFTSEEWESVRAVMYVARKVLKKVFKITNIWFLYREGPFGQAQKTVGHLHIQVIPYIEGLFKVNYQPISWAPGEVGDRLKHEKQFLEEKYEKYISKYGKFCGIGKRVVIGAYITNSKAEILLVKKKYSAYPDTWANPSGCIEYDESLEEALKREVKEETNLEIKDLKFAGIDEDTHDGVFSEGYKKKWHMIFMHYTAKVKSGRLKAGDDASTVKWVKLKDLKKYKLTRITQRAIRKFIIPEMK
jgi:ADP-ribose pyrophosphatase YjhB (NUDIX family)/diadenosine tetraphosphate (Ap4A) HIT family hydrolase